MKYKRSVYQTMALITQLGISMLTPILLCVFFAVFLQERFHIHGIFFVLLVVLGMLAGGRNCYLLVKKFIHSDKEPKK